VTQNIENIKVFCMANGHIKELSKLVKQHRDIRFVWQGKVPRTQILCNLTEDFTDRTGEELYLLTPSVTVPTPKKFFFQIQAIEFGGKNCSMIVCDPMGRKLPADWVSGPIAGFRTVHGQLFVVAYSLLRNFGTVYSYRIEREGEKNFLVRRRESMDFRVTEVQIKGQDMPQIKWTDDSFLGSEGEGRDNFTKAAVAAYNKANHNCFLVGCQPHYAILEKDEKDAYWEATRRELSKKIAQKEDGGAVELAGFFDVF